MKFSLARSVFGMSLLMSGHFLASQSMADTQTRAVGLSSRLTNGEVRRSVEILGFGAAHRAWSAPGLENPDLGLDLGIESTFVFRRNLRSQGDSSAVLPRIIPVPRVWGMWDLPGDFHLSGSFSPGFLYDGMTTGGGALQWMMFEDSDSASKVSLLGAYTHTSAFEDFLCNTFDVTAQVSRDLDVWQPYLGLGVMVAKGSVRKELMRDERESSKSTRGAIHGYLGARFDLGARLGVQADFFNSDFGASALMSSSF